MPLLIIIITLIAFIIVIIFLGSILTFFFTLSSRMNKDLTSMEPNKIKGWIDYIGKVYQGMEYFDQAPSEIITIKSKDGINLSGKYIPNENSKKTIICFHGYRSKGSIDFGNSSKFYYNEGFNLLVVDQRAGGKSQGKYIGMGAVERYDCLKWIEYINDRTQGSNDIYLAGVSMGAATVILATGLSLPQNVKGIIADCGFTSPYEIIKHTMKAFVKIPTFPILNIVGLIYRVKLGYWLKKISTLEVLRKNEIPILFIHGGDDTFVPVDMTIKNYEACNSPKKLLIIEGAGHGMSYVINPKIYEETVKEFLWH